jgi:hypothetical protein
MTLNKWAGAPALARHEVNLRRSISRVVHFDGKCGAMSCSVPVLVAATLPARRSHWCAPAAENRS